MTHFRQGYLSGWSHRADRPEDLLNGDYDLLVLASSWDRRCMCIAQASNLRAARGILFLFFTRDDLGLRDQHDRALQAFAANQCAECSWVGACSSEPSV